MASRAVVAAKHELLTPWCALKLIECKEMRSMPKQQTNDQQPCGYQNDYGMYIETVNTDKYAIVSDERTKPEAPLLIVQVLSMLLRLKIIWNDKIICLNFQIRLMRSFVTSLFQKGCETTEIQRRPPDKSRNLSGMVTLSTCLWMTVFRA